MTANSSQEMLAILRINQHIRSVNLSVRRIYMTALNAMLISRHITSLSRGYGKVTSELRSYSHSLSTDMNDIKEQVAELTVCVSNVVKLKRKYQLLEKATKTARQKGSAKLITGYESRLGDALQEMRNMYKNMTANIERSMKICKFGQNLAVSAKVESHGAKENTERLQYIADQLEQVMEQIENDLNAIKRQALH